VRTSSGRCRPCARTRPPAWSRSSASSSRSSLVAEAGISRLPDLDRYLRAAAQRLEKAPANLARDAQALDQVDLVEGRYSDLLQALRPSQRGAAQVVEIGWMIEELRVSLFAQSLGTAYSVSPQRILKAIARLAP